MTDAPALRARGVTKTFGGLTAVAGVDLEIATGSITALIGPNGAGKTTLFNLLTRFEPADSGELEFFGEPANRLAPGNWHVAAWSARSRHPWGFPS